MNIILFGFKSCGKTTLGKIIAERLGRPFYDTDEMIERQYERQTGSRLTFRQIYLTEGKEKFSQRESAALNELMSVENSVIAVGGSCVLNEVNRALLETLGSLIYLRIDKSALKARIFSKELPAFFDAADPEGSFERMYAERAPLYEKISPLVINVGPKTAQELEALIYQLEGKDGK